MVVRVPADAISCSRIKRNEHLHNTQICFIFRQFYILPILILWPNDLIQMNIILMYFPVAPFTNMI